MEIYSADEDSYLLRKVLEKEILKLIKKNPDLKFLEIGSGSGIQLQTALSSGIKKENIFSCDINPLSVRYCRELGFNSVVSNLFNDLKGGYDLIIFNPPYLPEDEREPKSSRIATTGGKTGSEIINEFLKQSKSHLNENGRIFLVISNLTRDINFLDYKQKIIAKKRLFFEELFVLELRI